LCSGENGWNYSLIYHNFDGFFDLFFFCFIPLPLVCLVRRLWLRVAQQLLQVEVWATQQGK
jgi:hypothetical protein